MVFLENCSCDLHVECIMDRWLDLDKIKNIIYQRRFITNKVKTSKDSIQEYTCVLHGSLAFASSPFCYIIPKRTVWYGIRSLRISLSVL